MLYLSKMKPDEFEAELYRVFQNMGYDAEITPATGDHGADLILNKGTRRIAVQAKHYAPNNRVGNKAVQEVFAATRWYNYEEGWVVTNLFFSNQAKEKAERYGVILKYREELKNSCLIGS